MFGLIWNLTAHAHAALRRFMPSNIVLDAIHTRRGLKWGAPAMLLAVPYALAAMFCAGQIEAGGSGWLDVLALLFAWNALKFLAAGPVTLVSLLRARSREARGRRHSIEDTERRQGGHSDSRRLHSIPSVAESSPLDRAAR
ncbi:MAG: sulfate permease [Burkholderiales bacterium]